MKRAMSIFCTATTPKIMRKMPVTSHGTHQLGLRFRSSNVFVGAIKILISRCDWERPRPAGSGAVGCTGAACIGGGGGVGPVGELINHPTFQFVESYWIFGSRICTVSVAS